MEFQIRRAVSADVDGIMRIMEEAKSNVAQPEWFVADDEAFVQAHLEEKGFVIVAEAENGTVAGFFLVKWPQREENLGLYLGFGEKELALTAVMDSAAVGGAYRGYGLQGRMLEEAEKTLPPGKYRYLMCTIHPLNTYSLKNMCSHGYKVMKIVKCYGGLERHILMKNI